MPGSSTSSLSLPLHLCLSFCLCLCLCSSLCVSLSVSPSASLCLCLYVSLCLSLCLSLCVSVSLTLSLCHILLPQFGVPVAELCTGCRPPALGRGRERGDRIPPTVSVFWPRVSPAGSPASSSWVVGSFKEVSPFPAARRVSGVSALLHRCFDDGELVSPVVHGAGVCTYGQGQGCWGTPGSRGPLPSVLSWVLLLIDSWPVSHGTMCSEEVAVFAAPT